MVTVACAPAAVGSALAILVAWVGPGTCCLLVVATAAHHRLAPITPLWVLLPCMLFLVRTAKLILPHSKPPTTIPTTASCARASAAAWVWASAVLPSAALLVAALTWPPPLAASFLQSAANATATSLQHCRWHHAAVAVLAWLAALVLGRPRRGGTGPSPDPRRPPPSPLQQQAWALLQQVRTRPLELLLALTKLTCMLLLLLVDCLVLLLRAAPSMMPLLAVCSLQTVAATGGSSGFAPVSNALTAFAVTGGVALAAAGAALLPHEMMAAMHRTLPAQIAQASQATHAWASGWQFTSNKFQAAQAKGAMFATLLEVLQAPASRHGLCIPGQQLLPLKRLLAANCTARQQLFQTLHKWRFDGSGTHEQLLSLLVHNPCLENLLLAHVHGRIEAPTPPSTATLLEELCTLVQRATQQMTCAANGLMQLYHTRSAPYRTAMGQILSILREMENAGQACALNTYADWDHLCMQLVLFRIKRMLSNIMDSNNKQASEGQQWGATMDKFCDILKQLSRLHGAYHTPAGTASPTGHPLNNSDWSQGRHWAQAIYQASPAALFEGYLHRMLFRNGACDVQRLVVWLMQQNDDYCQSAACYLFLGWAGGRPTASLQASFASARLGEIKGDILAGDCKACLPTCAFVSPEVKKSCVSTGVCAGPNVETCPYGGIMACMLSMVLKQPLLNDPNRPKELSAAQFGELLKELAPLCLVDKRRRSSLYERLDKGSTDLGLRCTQVVKQLRTLAMAAAGAANASSVTTEAFGGWINQMAAYMRKNFEFAAPVINSALGWSSVRGDAQALVANSAQGLSEEKLVCLPVFQRLQAMSTALDELLGTTTGSAHEQEVNELLIMQHFLQAALMSCRVCVAYMPIWIDMDYSLAAMGLLSIRSSLELQPWWGQHCKDMLALREKQHTATHTPDYMPAAGEQREGGEEGEDGEEEQRQQEEVVQQRADEQQQEEEVVQQQADEQQVGETVTGIPLHLTDAITRIKSSTGQVRTAHKAATAHATSFDEEWKNVLQWSSQVCTDLVSFVAVLGMYTPSQTLAFDTNTKGHKPVLDMCRAIVDHWLHSGSSLQLTQVATVYAYVWQAQYTLHTPTQFAQCVSKDQACQKLLHDTLSWAAANDSFLQEVRWWCFHSSRAGFRLQSPATMFHHCISSGHPPVGKCQACTHCLRLCCSSCNNNRDKQQPPGVCATVINKHAYLCWECADRYAKAGKENVLKDPVSEPSICLWAMQGDVATHVRPPTMSNQRPTDQMAWQQPMSAAGYG